MSADPIRRPPKVVLGVSLLALLLLPAVMLAGAGGMALLMFVLGCLGVIGLIAHKAYTPPYPTWLVALAIFLGWAWLSQFWSAYPKVEGFSNAEKILVMGLVFPAVIWLWTQMRDHVLGDILRKAIVVSFFLGVALLFIDALSGFKISFLFDPMHEGETYARRHADGVRNIGRGAVFAAVMIMPIAGLIWERFEARIAVLIAMLAITVIGFKLNVTVAIFLPWLGLAFAYLGRRYPTKTVKGLMVLAIAMIMGAPFIAGLAQSVDKEALRFLPMSWTHRLYMWEFLPTQILEHPFIGQGFDSARTFNEQLVLPNGETVSLVSMHTHNAGLQIWLETGLIGALLAIFCVCQFFKPLSEFVTEKSMRGFGMSGFLISFIVTASLSFGVWQFWWWGSLVFGLAIIQLYRVNSDSIA